ncbi:mechanosensitive ion channel family protein [Marinifilum fragile]|uniref:mechanosensitive ion channel family protein n=1 Tax=Marinifilum fragile TaxID=570161 RepID=UPI002AA66A68|nr:mechanosensitive ion channel family protein [Marinifilum fragile]
MKNFIISLILFTVCWLQSDVCAQELTIIDTLKAKTDSSVRFHFKEYLIDTTENFGNYQDKTDIDHTIKDTIHSKDTAKLPSSIHAKNASAPVETSESKPSLLKSMEQNVPDKPMEVLEVISFSKIFWTVILLVVAYYIIKLVIKILDLFSERSAKFRITIKSIIPVFRIAFWSITIFAIIKGIYNPPFETVIAFTASVGIAVGLAAQDLLKNVFGGMALLLDQPFKVGDKIDSGKYYGEVIEIGLRATRLVTPDDSIVSVPNSELVNSSVSNSNSGELNCQVVAEIYLPIDIDTHRVRQIATESAQVSRYVYLNKPITVLFFNEVKERRSYLKMRLKAYVMDIRYEFQFKSDMTEIVVRELLKQEIISKDELF